MEKQRLPGSGKKQLDRWLRELLPGKSWNEVRKLAKTGKVFINGFAMNDPTATVSAGAEIEIRMNAPRTNRVPCLPRKAIRHLDAHVVVVEKPPGISTVPFDETEQGTLNQLTMETISERGRRPPLGIVHRVDKETSGLVMFTRTVSAKLHIKEQFRCHSVGRRYIAIAHGNVRDGTIKSRLVQDRGDGRRGSTEDDELGREAVLQMNAAPELHIPVLSGSF